MRYQSSIGSRVFILVSLMTFALCVSARVIRSRDTARFVQAPQQRMEAIARSSDLGAKRYDSQEPQPTESGSTSGLKGLYQCFERGCVYYSPTTGAHVVKGVIFTKYVDEGYERASLGFPVSTERPCAPRSSSRIFGSSRQSASSTSFQDFEGGSIIVSKSQAGSIATKFAQRVGDSGLCESSSPTVSRASSGWFRITINGFSCHQPTYDDATQRDGVDDEVFLQAHLNLYETNGQRPGPSSRSLVIGDTNGFPQRLRGGSGHSVFGGNGGFHEGDSFPAGSPWRRDSNPARDRPPLLIWEGELVRGEHVLVILPSIWEWDSAGSLEALFDSAIANMWSDRELATVIIRSARGGAGPGLNFGAQLQKWFELVQISADSLGDSRSRPIRMLDREDSFAFDPKVLVFTYESAARIAASNNNNLGPGVYKVEFRDDDRLRGFYSLYIQVEHLP